MLASIVIRGPGAPPEPLGTDPEGWYSTRDLGRVDAEGLVWIEGRADAMIVSGGLNVSPGEVERVIEELPGVREAVVFGVPDEEWARWWPRWWKGMRRPSAPTRWTVTAAAGSCEAAARPAYWSSAGCPATWTGKVMRWQAAALLAPAAGTGHPGGRPGPGARAGSSKQPRETR